MTSNTPSGDASDHGPVVEKYVEGLSPERAAMTRQLDAAIRATYPGFDVAIKYGILMYAIAGDWRHWVVSVDAHPKAGVGLKFLFGVMMADERHVLRGGSSVLKTWDFASDAQIDVAAVESYVAEAVLLYPEYKANDKAILESARAAAAAPSAGRGRA